MPGIDSFVTDRLAAARLRAADLDDLCRLHRDPRVMATLGGVRSADETRQGLAKALAHWERHGFGIWVFRDRADGVFVGRAGLRHLPVDGCDEVELLYALRAEHWGRGLATEMAGALVNMGFEHLGLTNVIALALPTNRASRRVMEKAGLQYERDVIHASLPHVLYRLTASVWATRDPRR
ncbi:MAG: GNAT family N-acetyltransferase [Planctomycetota bacterium]|jgi:RimJ/RimL family protein N-acetyltransferase